MDNIVKIFFAGDFCSTSSTKEITVSDVLKQTIASCDFKVCNFEVPLKPDADFPSQRRKRFFNNDDAPEFLRNLGFNLFSIATNHTFDWDDEGFDKTKQALGDDAFGAGIYEEAYKVKTVEVEGIKIGFLAVCFAAYKGVFDDVTRLDGYGCAYINDLHVNHVISDAKSDVDYLIVLSHDGIEYVDIPMPETIARYHDFIEWGADAVIGTHPHCPQGWEEYKGKPIFYSLGNFYFNSMPGYDYRAWNRPHWYEGLCVILSINTSEHRIFFETVNTRNIDNLNIVIDHDQERDSHNVQLCSYLSNKQEYGVCFNKQMGKIVREEYLPKMDTTFHDSTFKLTVKALVRYVWNKMQNKANKGDDAVKRMLKHDTMRAGLTRCMGRN